MDSLRNYSSSENEEDSSPPRKRDSDDRERKSTSSRDKDKKDRRPSSSSRYEKEDHRHRSRSTEKDTKYSSSGKDNEHKSKKDHYKDDRKEYRTDRRDRDRDRDRKEKHRRERREEKKEHSSKHRSEGKEHRRRDDRKKSRSRSRDRSRRDYRGDRKKSHRRRSYSKSKSPENRSSCSPLPPTNPRPSKAQDTDSPPKQQPQKPPQVKAFDFSALVETKPVVCTKPDLPSYYNPSVINANKYTEQIQKRKLLWGKKAAEQSSSQWNSAKFSQDTDGKVQSKFLRLMGVKNVDATKPEATNSTAAKDDQIKSREDMFSNMQQQYDVARQTTHTMRGYGLGFSSQSRQL